MDLSTVDLGFLMMMFYTAVSSLWSQTKFEPLIILSGLKQIRFLYVLSSHWINCKHSLLIRLLRWSSWIDWIPAGKESTVLMTLHLHGQVPCVHLWQIDLDFYGYAAKLSPMTRESLEYICVAIKTHFYNLGLSKGSLIDDQAILFWRPTNSVNEWR